MPTGADRKRSRHCAGRRRCPAEQGTGDGRGLTQDTHAEEVAFAARGALRDDLKIQADCYRRIKFPPS